MAGVRFVAAAALVAAALAACPNQCSGHGICENNDICTCYANWQGADCSLRTCAFGKSWALDASDPHSFQECSGQGSCDRGTGECACFTGFTGRACARSECPNSCSGNGACKLLSEIGELLTVPYDSDAWDANRIQTCVCDNGFFGPDCSQRYCPTGDDPLTLCDSDSTGMYQELRFTLASTVSYDPADAAYVPVYTTATETPDIFGTGQFSAGGVQQTPATVRDTAGQMRVTYTDQFNGTYVTHGVGSVFAASPLAASNALEVALETLPEKKVHDVLVDSEMVATATPGEGVWSRRFVVGFVPDTTNSANVGLQNALTCDSGYSCTEAGCQPMVAMPFLYRYAATTPAKLGTSFATTSFYTGDANTWAAFDANAFVRLHSSSQPQMPFNVPIATEVSAVAPNPYDLRIVVAVVDPYDRFTGTQDVYYTRVVAGWQNITSANEAFGQTGTTGVWSNGKAFTSTLTGFTLVGPITDASRGWPVPGAPGVLLQFPDTDMVPNDGDAVFFEILIKLPHCASTVQTAATPVDAITRVTPLAGAPVLTPTSVSANVENMECSNRGQCDRTTATCSCFPGYFGLACHRQTVLV